MNNKSPIAIIGMAGLFPGAPDLDIFWQNIINKVEATREVPKNRWIVDPDLMYHPDPMPDKALSRRCCLINDFQFDPEGIDIDKDLLNELDPLYHLVLHTGRAAISDCKASFNSRERTGVVLAAIALPTDASSSVTREIFGSSFEEKLFGSSTINSFTRNQSLSSRVTSLPGAILARGFTLGGGSYTLDAACASSLYAVKLACDELQSHRTDAMLAGGVSRPECLYTQVGFSQLRALSPSGRCAPFDESADGLVVGEGAGILVLKRLEDAINDGDNIYGLIRGIGLSNDMRGNLLAPDSEGQLRAMRSAYKSAGWSPHDIDLIECHGAGTPVGDITELHSLRSLWGESGWSEQQCAIGSIKSMIGHLLTGAGAAGMIKTLLAFKHRTLPPSLNFKKASEKSPLIDSPFRVQTSAEEWKKRNADLPRRAAVSAFGFGGINGHLLFEEWNPETSKASWSEAEIPLKAGHTLEVRTEKHVPIAIVGMEAIFGSLKSLRDFQETVLSGKSIIAEKPEDRWIGCDDIANRHLGRQTFYGGFIDELSIDISDFRIPPNQIQDILPQHLLMLKVAAGAMADANLELRDERPQMGVIIGLEFDFEATNFHQRWNLSNSVKTWKKRHQLKLSENQEESWLKSLKEESGHLLSHTRTLGALGGIVASRIAREFRFGGPSFIVSCGEASGLRALETGVRFLQNGETNSMLVGAIDLFGDVRSIITSNKIIPFSKQDKIRPFDRHADGTIPGEGAAALVLKRLDAAIKDGDRIYSVIKGIGSANGGGIEKSVPSKESYMLSMKRSFKDAEISPSSISFIETHGSGDGLQDSVESEALNDYFSKNPDSKDRQCALGSVKPNVGHAGAAAGLASLVKMSLSLYQEIIPPLSNFTEPVDSLRRNKAFHIPVYPQFWLRDRQDGSRRACVASMTTDGTCMHVVLEGFDYSSTDNLSGQTQKKVSKERKRPLGNSPYGLFVVEGDSKDSLIKGLDSLLLHVKRKSLAAYKNIEHLARSWYLENKLHPDKKYAVSITLGDISRLENLISKAKDAVLSDTPRRANGSGGINYSLNRLGLSGETAFVFPGSGNHYISMGRGVGVQWPDILRRMDAKTLQLKTQLLPGCFIPQRISWSPGWEKDARDKIISDPLNMIFGQVAHGGVVSGLMKYFELKPTAVIGYSLGESAGLFAMGAWPDRGQMLKRMHKTDLFSTSLAGPCNAARKAWSLPPDEDVNWSAAVINRSADTVSKFIGNWPTTRLLIINTQDECVIGGRKVHVKAAIKMLGCTALFLDGVITVHCDAAIPVAEAYKALHIFPTSRPDNLRFYSCALGHSYDLTSESTASSILKQALSGFDFPATIKQAYNDGVRIFLEMGPGSSCTRMINKILKNKPHLAASACVNGEDDYITILNVLSVLSAERALVNLDKLYGNDSYPLTVHLKDKNKSAGRVSIIIGGKSPSPALPHLKNQKQKQETGNQQSQLERSGNSAESGASRNQKPVTGKASWSEAEIPLKEGQRETRNQHQDLIKTMSENIEATSKAHQKFLDFSSNLTKNFAKTFSIQTRLLETVIKEKGQVLESEDGKAAFLQHDFYLEPAFSRDMCMEFATGSVEKMLGSEFAVVDTYKARVRLPDEPLMLVDRIISVEGEKGSLGHGRVVTEHDVLSGAWYLDGGHAPVCISVEAGQADLFLCSYLGIDLVVKGERSYRLLDANVIFHTGLPKPGDIIRYEIEIEKFVRQGDTYLFFFNFEGRIDNIPLISMSNGCAGFFTEDEVINSGGIILTDEDTRPLKGKKIPDWKNLVEVYPESYNDDAIEGLREGNLSKCFGPLFNGINIAESLRLPGSRMKLIDRILSFNPNGGRYGLGSIRAEADIHPDDWFLTCHFKDDMVMPGTLMYECCAHTLRVFIQRIGWVTDKPGVCYEPVPGVESVLKCRGPVTPKTSHVIYEVDIKELGYAPEPYVIADAHMYADDHRIVMFKDMSMKMTGITRTEIESFWKEKLNLTSKIQQPTIFDRSHIIEFATGKPSKAFGDKYKPFDSERFIARLPAPPYSFIDRITSIEPGQWLLEPDGWIEAEYDVKPNAWYFRANRTSSMPYCIINEIALQACGWLASYMGSALKSENDLRFRNLGGNTTLYQNILPDKNTLTTRTRLTQVSIAGDIIIEQFDFKVFQSGLKIYEGDTSFGFFTKEALAIQTGIHGGDENAYVPDAEEMKNAESFNIKHEPPFDPNDKIDDKPDDKNPVNNKTDRAHSLSMPAKAVLMLDQIDMYIPDGGPYGLGFIRGIKKVDPDEWFFKAHFFQDPVCPGSLGIESFLQLIRFIAIDRFKSLEKSHRFELLTNTPHNWIYRGQILPENRKIEVEAVVTKISDKANPEIFANGYLKVDGLYIYKMDNFGFRLVPVK